MRLSRYDRSERAYERSALMAQENGLPHMKVRIAPVLAVIAALTMTGCTFTCSIGGSQFASSEEIESQVSDSYREQTGIALVDIECEQVRGEVGAEIDCSATNDQGVDLEIDGTVTVVDSDADTIDFDWEVIQATAPGEHFEAAAKDALEAEVGQGLSEVRCPDSILLEAGTDVRCTVVTDDGTEYGATMTLTDGDGGFDIVIDGAPDSSAI